MAFGETLAELRRQKDLTQQELAERLYVTRQAVSRWETGETTPGIDMMKLLAIVLDVPVTRLLEMPGSCCNSCGMILADQAERGHEADGSISDAYCVWCYDEGRFLQEVDMESMIEDCAPRMVEHGGFSLDEAVSLLGAVLPHLDRWRVAGMKS